MPQELVKLESLPPSVASLLRDEWIGGERWHYVLPDIVPPAAVPAIEAEIARLSMVAPATADQLRAALGKLRLMTKAAKGSQDDLVVTLQIYAAELRQFPGVVALEAIRRWGDREIFWPAWAELRAVCLGLDEPRIRLLVALEKALERVAEPEPPYTPPTDAEKARASALVAAAVSAPRRMDRVKTEHPAEGAMARAARALKGFKAPAMYVPGEDGYEAGEGEAG